MAESGLSMGNLAPWKEIITGQQVEKSRQLKFPIKAKESPKEGFVLPNATLALLDPYLRGGFRNQHMRFVGLVYHASSNGIPNLLLDSLHWSSNTNSHVNVNVNVNVTKKTLIIPHQTLFNVEYWNEFANEIHRQQGWTFPRLVNYTPDQHPEWNPKTGLFRTLPHNSNNNNNNNSNNSNSNSIDLWSKSIRKCNRPYAFGSGKGSGRLWNLNARLQRMGRQTKNPSKQNSGNDLLVRRSPLLIKEHHPVEQAAYLALKPSALLKTAVDAIFQEEQSSVGSLLAIHPRCEPDILKSRCSKDMSKSLPQILSMIENSPFFSTQHPQPEKGKKQKKGKRTLLLSPRYERAFLCISRPFMELSGGSKHYQKFKTRTDKNLVTLNKIGEKGLWGGKVPVVESSRYVAASLQNKIADPSGMAAQVVSFFVAIQADAFVGTVGSSWSTDVWTVRYYMGKGDTNYAHDKNGITQIGNGGLPPSYTCANINTPKT